MMKPLPSCLDCGTELKRHHNKRCRKCFSVRISALLSGEKHYRFKDGRKKPCITCGEIITAPYPRNCRKCYTKSLIGKVKPGLSNTGKTRFKKGSNPWNKGISVFEGNKNPMYVDGRNGYLKNRKRLLRKIGKRSEIMKTVIESNYKEFGNHTCSYCHEILSKDKIELDHKTPTSRGGSDDIENLTVSCHRCNSGKRDKTEEEYLLFKSLKGAQ